MEPLVEDSPPPPYEPPRPPATPNSNTKKLFCLGTLHAILGTLCLIFNVLAIIYSSFAAYIGSGIWGGLLFIAAGLIGCETVRRDTRCWKVTFMTVSIIATVVAFIVVVMSAVGLVAEFYYYCDYDLCVNKFTPERNALIFFHGATLLCALLEVAIALWASLIFCRSICNSCGPTPHIQTGVMMIEDGNQGSQLVNVDGRLLMVMGPQPQAVYTIPVPLSHPGFMALQEGAASPYASTRDTM